MFGSRTVSVNMMYGHAPCGISADKALVSVSPNCLDAISFIRSPLFSLRMLIKTISAFCFSCFTLFSAWAKSLCLVCLSALSLRQTLSISMNFTERSILCNWLFAHLAYSAIVPFLVIALDIPFSLLRVFERHCNFSFARDYSTPHYICQSLGAI